MFYFINSGLVVAYACWRSVVTTLVIALVHHGLLSFTVPSLVWPAETYSWIHFWNHAGLGSLNCALGVTIAAVISRHLEHMEHQASRDELTSLLNRRGIHVALRQALLDENAVLHVLVMDLDEFKSINDTAGHAAGDTVLRQTAKELSRLAPQNAAIGRSGGDEFVVILRDAQWHEIDSFVDSVLEWSRLPFLYDGRELRFGLSIGIASSALRVRSPDQLFAEADMALYRAKKPGSNKAQVFSEELREQARQRKTIADEIVRGLERDEFIPFFQTQHDPLQGTVIGLEALARWNHPTRGLIGPECFIEIATEISKVADIDAVILQKAVQHVVEWENAGIHASKLAVNVSCSRLRDPKLADTILQLPEMRAQLALEFVETILIDKLTDHDQWMIDWLRGRNIRIEIDDFGTGRASLVALTRLRPDAIKIDRELVAPTIKDPDQQLVLRAIIEMANGLGVETTAEGVETHEQANLLRKLGASALQGYFFNRPFPPEEILEHLPYTRDVAC
ncbi:Phytochrome-like protein cph2 [Roseovarius sp. THAF9]|nr:Phytochrome-like protein cph2 [Roseovarius sp. THAF9]